MSHPVSYASYSLITFGCRVNQADSLVIERDLQSRGLTHAPAEEADLIVVNTCSVTASADQGARQTIRRVARLNPDVRVIVTGCYATRRPGEVAILPNVVRVFSNTEKESLVSRVFEGTDAVTTAQRFAGGDDACGGTLAPGLGGRTALTLRVQTGCEQRCSYCIIPQTRGAGRSLPSTQVRTRVQQAIDAGYKEIVLTGVHLGSYGRDLQDGSSLSTLVAMLADRDDEVIFRISSLEPMDCTPAIVSLVAQSPRLAPHFHLPLQHGSDEMLRAMRRPYTAACYERLVTGIRELMPHASIGSDIIVGFPGETDDHFDQMRSLVSRLPLTHLHVFPYSDRPGTEAQRMPDKVESHAIRARGQEIRAIGHEMTRRFRASQAGTVSRALTVDDGWSAVTPNYLKLKLNEPRPRNEWIEVRIEEGEVLRGIVDV